MSTEIRDWLVKNKFTLFAAYVELANQGLRFAAITQGFIGSELPDPVKREVLGGVCSDLRKRLAPLGLSPRAFEMLEAGLLEHVFSADHKLWVVSKK